MNTSEFGILYFDIDSFCDVDRGGKGIDHATINSIRCPGCGKRRPPEPAPTNVPTSFDRSTNRNFSTNTSSPLRATLAVRSTGPRDRLQTGKSRESALTVLDDELATLGAAESFRKRVNENPTSLTPTIAKPVPQNIAFMVTAYRFRYDEIGPSKDLLTTGAYEIWSRPRTTTVEDSDKTLHRWKSAILFSLYNPNIPDLQPFTEMSNNKEWVKMTHKTPVGEDDYPYQDNNYTSRPASNIFSFFHQSNKIITVFFAYKPSREKAISTYQRGCRLPIKESTSTSGANLTTSNLSDDVELTLSDEELLDLNAIRWEDRDIARDKNKSRNASRTNSNVVKSTPTKRSRAHTRGQSITTEVEASASVTNTRYGRQVKAPRR